MDILTISALAVITAIISIIIKEYKPEYSMLVGFAGTVIILVAVMANIEEIISFISEIAAMSKISDENLGILIKSVGIGYVTQFASDICKDTGESGLASKVELAGKVCILVICIPVINSLIDIVKDVMN